LSTFRNNESDQETADLIALLVRYRADVDMRNSKGESPLHIACQYGRVACVKWLVNAKANVWAQDYQLQGIIDSAKNRINGGSETDARIQECINLVCCKMNFIACGSRSAVAGSAPSNVSLVSTDSMIC